MKLPFAEPGFCVKESLGQAQFLRPGKQLGGRFFKPCFNSSTPGFAGWQGAEKKLARPGETVVLLAEVSPTVAKGRPSFCHQRNET
jgi:hypothetical protein